MMSEHDSMSMAYDLLAQAIWHLREIEYKVQHEVPKASGACPACELDKAENQVIMAQNELLKHIA